MRIPLLLALVPLALSACTADPVWAPDAAVEAAVYRDDSPPSITLFTMINNRSNEGGHSGLMINGDQRVMFDPAGSWWHRTAPERNDVHYGMTPLMLKFYIDYHARETYRVVSQTVEVPPEVATRALQLAEARGAVPKAMCGSATSGILKQLPGFESVSQSLFPARIMESFGQLPGVETAVYYDDDADDNTAVLMTQQHGAPAQPSR